MIFARSTMIECSPDNPSRKVRGAHIGPRLGESQRIRQARLIRGAVADADAAASSARTADMAVIDPREARQLADELGTVIAHLGRLRRPAGHPREVWPIKRSRHDPGLRPSDH
jgi:hypothetical protein